jgi:hypothetical protein
LLEPFIEVLMSDILTEGYKLTDWENEPTVSDLKKNLDDANLDQQSHLQDVERWLSNLHMTGVAKPPNVKGQSAVAPKLIRKQAEWRYSSLSEPFLSSPDIFDVSPRTAGDRKRAIQNALILNYQFNNLIGRVELIDTYVRDAVDIGTVILKTGWISEEEEIEEEVPVYEFTSVMDEMLLKQYMAFLELRATNQDLYAEVSNPGIDQALDILIEQQALVVPQQVGTELVTRIIETKNQPTVETCLAENIIIDPSCNGNMKKAEFVGEKFKTSMSELEKDGRYRNLTRVNVEAASPLTDPDHQEGPDNSTFNFDDNPRKQFVVHSIWCNWDIDNSGITQPICAFWVNEVMIRIEKNPFPDKEPPFVKAVYMPVRKSNWGEPDGELLEENQKIIGAITRGMIDLMGKSANSQTAFRKGAMDPANKQKFLRGDDYELNTPEDPRNAIYTHQYPEIPNSAYSMITWQNNDAESMSGVKAFTSGITGDAIGASVRNGRSALDAASKRELGILRRLATGIIEVGRKILAMNAEWLSEEETVRVTNEKFIPVRRDDLTGKFDLELNISTAEEDNKKAEELAYMLQTTGNNMDPELTKIILSDIARLRKMPAVAEKLEAWEPKPDPMEQKKKELELYLLKAQIAKEEALAIKHATEAELNGVQGFQAATQAKLNEAKAGKENAQARALGSDADLKDLDFLETESGTKQAREKEKINLKAAHDREAKQVINN